MVKEIKPHVVIIAVPPLEQIKIIKLSDIKNNNFILSPRYYLNKKKARKNGKNKTKPRVQK